MIHFMQTHNRSELQDVQTAEEEYNDTCIINKKAKSHEWLFWDCFSDELSLKSELFWKKSWDFINQTSYIEHMILQIIAWIKYIYSVKDKESILLITM